ncbi:hypothetical protein GCM10027568_23600 [Humibacter soli]
MTADDRIRIGGLQLARELHDFVANEALPASGLAASGMTPARFWSGVEGILTDLMPTNHRLLSDRDRLQAELDDWYRQHGGDWDATEYRTHLERIGYLLPEPEHVTVTTADVDPEIAELAGPQLVVPITNARYSLSAANARWGSVYDALYGTDALPGAAKPGGYDPDRGAQVIAAVRELLDEFFPLENGSHADATGYAVENGALVVTTPSGATGLRRPRALRGVRGEAGHPEAVLLRRNGIHWEICFDAGSPIGSADAAGVSDVIAEAALTTIIDFEDSVSVVDASDKVLAYRNWLGLNRGDLTETFEKGGKPLTRRLADDRHYVSPDGSDLVLRGR